jgi:REP element-mobilizing transposase RayT
MPDHVHLILAPSENISLSRITRGIKGALARLINKRRETAGAFWQDESWDRVVRDPEELREKLEYMLNNPVKAGLVTRPEDWIGWHCAKGEC